MSEGSLALVAAYNTKNIQDLWTLQKSFKIIKLLSNSDKNINKTKILLKCNWILVVFM